MPIDLPPFDVPPGYVREESGLIKKKSIMPGVFGGMVGLIGSAGKVVSQTATTILLTSGTTWSVPADWNWEDPGPNGYANWIDCYGGGGSGGDTGGSTTSPGGGGGGGAFARVYNLACTPGGTLYYSVGAAGERLSVAGDTWCNRSSNAPPTSTSFGAKADAGQLGGDGAYDGESYYVGSGGTGGLASQSIGDVTRNGGSGADGSSYYGNGGGGGGCAGPSSAGGNGTTTGYGGSGGGGYAGDGGDSNMYGELYGSGAGGAYGAKSVSGDPGRPGCILISYYPYI